MTVLITEKNLQILEYLARHYVATRQQLQEALFAHIQSPRSLTKRLEKLLRAGYISKASMSLVKAGHQAKPVYHPNAATARLLADWYSDDAWLDIFVKPPRASRLFHWVAVSQVHFLLSRAIEATEDTSLLQFYNEWEPINKGSAKSQIFSLSTKLQEEPLLQCQPDAGCLLERGTHRKVFYLEVDRNTDSIKRIVQKKPPGYYGLACQSLHRKHFPSTNLNSFGILFITTNPDRRDRLIAAIAGGPAGHLWRAVCIDDLTSDQFFTKPIWRHPTEKELVPLLA